MVLRPNISWFVHLDTYDIENTFLPTIHISEWMFHPEPHTPNSVVPTSFRSHTFTCGPDTFGWATAVMIETISWVPSVLVLLVLCICIPPKYSHSVFCNRF